MAEPKKKKLSDRQADRMFLKGVRDILVYAVFLVMFTIVVFTTSPDKAFQVNEKLRDFVLGDDFDEVLTVSDTWDYIGTVLLEALYAESSQDGLSGRPGYILQVCHTFLRKRVFLCRARRLRIRRPRSVPLGLAVARGGRAAGHSLGTPPLPNTISNAPRSVTALRLIKSSALFASSSGG